VLRSPIRDIVSITQVQLRKASLIRKLSVKNKLKSDSNMLQKKEKEYREQAAVLVLVSGQQNAGT
jgi:hypothetical protein